MKKIYITAIIFIIALSANAQFNSFWSVNWQMSQGVGSVNEYIGDFSNNGFELEGKYFISPAIAIGGKFGWNSLYEQKIRDTYQYSENTHVNSVQRRYLYSMPIMLTASWFPTEYDIENSIFPYIALGAGTVWTEQETRNGLYYSNKTQWSFVVNPELGIILKFGERMGVNLKAGYTYGSFKSLGGSIDGKLNEIDNYSMMNYSIGLTFMY